MTHRPANATDKEYTDCDGDGNVPSSCKEEAAAEAQPDALERCISTHTTRTLGPPPDGGLLAWTQVVGAFFLFVNSWGIANTYGVYQTYYEQTLFSDHSSEQIAWIGSLQSFLLLIVSALAGPLFDKGYFRSLVTLGSLLVVFGMMMTSLCTAYWQAILAQGLVVGVGAGCLFVPAVSIVATYFDKKRALAVGIVTAGSSIGGVVYPIIFIRLVDKLGFAWTTRIIAFIALATLIVPSAGMKPRIRAAKARPLLLPRAFLEVPYSTFTLGLFTGFMALYIPFFFITPYARAQTGANATLATYMLPILNGASTFGRVLGGSVAGRIGPLNTLIPCTLAAAILAFAWIGIHNVPGIIVFSVLYGFFSGTFVSLPPSTMAALSSDLSQIGTRMGQSFFVAGLGVLIGTPVAGVLIKGDDFVRTQVFCGALIAVSVVLMVTARVVRTGPVLLATS
ncbi:Monocarboxylate transporter [Ceraceosorus bombacis]|uniref:Monocarboxylate transporter n=1 Tax=Ceraceosorus bombacis TaxID=401625 RepID=A0A0P1BA37_9BASI|nr:Monocarboxylate transporter [Ceraceosorus bombacis]